MAKPTYPLAPPWEAFDPESVPKHNASVRLNGCPLAMRRFVAERTAVSEQKVLNRILIPAIEDQAAKLYEG
jgi:hypothetical protein